MKWTQTILAGALLVVACSKGVEPPDLAEPPPDMSDPGYPEAPYGNVAGKVPPNFTFQGYFAPMRTTGLSTAETFGEVTFDKLRMSGQKFAMIQLGAYW